MGIAVCASAERHGQNPTDDAMRCDALAVEPDDGDS